MEAKEFKNIIYFRKNSLKTQANILKNFKRKISFSISKKKFSDFEELKEIIKFKEKIKPDLVIAVEVDVRLREDIINFSNSLV